MRLEAEVGSNAIGFIGNAIAEHLHAHLSADLAVGCDLGHEHLAICACEAIGVDVAVVDEPRRAGCAVDDEVVASGKADGQRVGHVFHQGNRSFSVGCIWGLFNADGDPAVVLQIRVGTEQGG